MNSNHLNDDIIDHFITTGLLNNNSNNNSNNNLKNNLNYEMIIYSDGGHERVKKRTGFGIYVTSKSKIYNYINETKIIKKIYKDTFIYNKNTKDIIYYNLNSEFDTISNNNKKIYCKNEECNNYAVYSSHLNNGIFCKIHKLENMQLNNIFFNYDPTNIRAEGYGILYSLIYIYTIIVLNLKDKSEILKKISIHTLNNITNNIEEFKLENNNLNLTKNILIVTDSEFWINVITKWMNNWIKMNSIYDKKNLDLIIHINYYLNLLNKNQINISFMHVKGHADKKIKDQKLNKYQKGNIIADALANLAKKNETLEVKIA
jgi:ribonuclease HI